MKWKKFIFISTLIVGILAILFSLTLPKYYKATVLFLPPTSSSGLRSLIENFSVDILRNEGITGDVCTSILKSRELRERIVEKYDLMEVYHKQYIEHVLKQLDNNIVIDTEMQVGIGASNIISISISVIDKSPERASQMANDLYNFLEEQLIELNIKKARNHRIFLEKRVKKNKGDLATAEDSLRNFQERNGAIEITSQAQAIIETAAFLKAQLIKTEVAREALRSYLSETHPKYQRLTKEIEAYKTEYTNLHNGKRNLANGKDVIFPINDIPELGLRYYRLRREVEIQNKLHEMLVPLYEQAKIQEAKQIPVLRLVDRAKPPTYKFKPKRAFIVIGIVGVYIAFCMLFIFYREYLNRMKEENPHQYQKINEIYQTIKFKRKLN